MPTVTSWVTETCLSGGLVKTRVVPVVSGFVGVKGAIEPAAVSPVVCSGIPSYRPIGVIQNYII